jgi:alpha-L-fucosidase
MRVNGEAIRGTRPWTHAETTTACGVPVRFTRGRDALHALLLDPPRGDEVRVRAVPVASNASVRLLGRDECLTWSRRDDDLVVQLPRPLGPQAAYALRIAPPPAV